MFIQGTSAPRSIPPAAIRTDEGAGTSGTSPNGRATGIHSASRRPAALQPAAIPRHGSFAAVIETSDFQQGLDRKLARIQKEFVSIFENRVPSAVYRDAEPVIEVLRDPNASFATRMARVKAYVERYRDADPRYITDLARMIDCQLLVYGVSEDQAHLAHSTHSAAIKDCIRHLATHCENDAARVCDILSSLSVASVLTAHPTSLHEPGAIARLHRASPTFDDARALRDACIALWEQSGGRGQRPSVRDEAQNNVEHLQRVRHEIRRIHKAIDDSLEPMTGPVVIPPVVNVDSWIGGDRDGNMLVDAQAMQEVMALHSDIALRRYQEKLGEGHLKKNSSFRSLVDAHAPGAAQQIVDRIEATRHRLSTDGQSVVPSTALPYSRSEELIADLEALRPCLPDGAPRLKLSRFTREIVGAGFHGAAIDVRQNSAAHEAAVADLLRGAGRVDDYAGLSEADKQALLWTCLQEPDAVRLYQADCDYAPQTRSEMKIFEQIAALQARYGERAMPNYIIANTESVSDILEPMLLMKQVGLAGSDGLKMSVIPLIETVPDLKQGRGIVGTLLDRPQYREWLAARDNIQQVMVGYSDSNRLDGPLASNWEIQKALIYLQDVTAEHGVELKIFHGRGGTVARGAGFDPLQEVEMLPQGAARRGLRHTEQGEEIAQKYGTQAAAERNLHAMTAATIEANLRPHAAENPAHHAVMDTLSERSAQAYRALVSHPAFIAYYNQATPVGYVQHLNAGSRAASRAAGPNQQLALQQLRAIPWVAGWNQSRAMMPAWYGMGTALSEFVAGQSVDQDAPPAATPESTSSPLQNLHDMYKEWPFFRHLIDRTEGELAKVDLSIVQEYARLVDNPATGAAIQNAIADEFARTRDIVLKIKGTRKLLQNEPAMAASLERKAPCLDTANALQVSLMQAERASVGLPEHEELRKGVIGTMHAIQSGLGRFG